MARAGTYGPVRTDRTRAVKDAEAWIGNGLATILAGTAVAAGVIGMLIAFGYINEDSTTPFEDGIIWMLGGLILGLCANVFRREHHVVDGTFEATLDRSAMYDTGVRMERERGGRYDESRSERRFDDERRRDD